jgi:hypothetical protein
LDRRQKSLFGLPTVRSGHTKMLATAGTTVILYGDPQSMCAIVLSPSQKTSMKYGTFFHDDMINQPVGKKVGPCAVLSCRLCTWHGME